MAKQRPPCAMLQCAKCRWALACRNLGLDTMGSGWHGICAMTDPDEVVKWLRSDNLSCTLELWHQMAKIEMALGVDKAILAELKK